MESVFHFPLLRSQMQTDWEIEQGGWITQTNKRVPYLEELISSPAKKSVFHGFGHRKWAPLSLSLHSCSTSQRGPVTGEGGGDLSLQPRTVITSWPLHFLPLPLFPSRLPNFPSPRRPLMTTDSLLRICGPISDKLARGRRPECAPTSALKNKPPVYFSAFRELVIIAQRIWAVNRAEQLVRSPSLVHILTQHVTVERSEL